MCGASRTPSGSAATEALGKPPAGMPSLPPPVLGPHGTVCPADWCIRKPLLFSGGPFSLRAPPTRDCCASLVLAARVAGS